MYNDPLQTTSLSKFYYRLKSVDVDGSYRYSGVVFLEAAEKRPFTVVQNPFRDKLSIIIGLEGPLPVVIRLYDAKGRLLKAESQKGSKGVNTFTVTNLAPLPRGVYIVEAWIGEQRRTKKVIKE
jgi:hypothetical protein